MNVEPFVIENESEADDYLNVLLKNPEYRSMEEVMIRATKFIKDEIIKNYFIEEARRKLET